MGSNGKAGRARKNQSAETAPSPEDLGLDEVDAASAESMDASDPPAFGGTTGVGSGEGAGNDREQRIRFRAHELWQQAGSPPGAELDFWLAAERELGGSAAREGDGE